MKTYFWDCQGLKTLLAQFLDFHHRTESEDDVNQRLSHVLVPWSERPGGGCSGFGWSQGWCEVFLTDLLVSVGPHIYPDALSL